MRLLKILLFAGIILFTACGSPAPTPTSIPLTSLQTQAVQTAYALLTEQAPQVTPTLPLPPTETPTPTATAAPTKDLSAVKFESLYFVGTEEMVLIFTLNGASGNFRATGNEHEYTCAPSDTTPGQMLCRGAYQAPGRDVTFSLFETSRTDPIWVKNMIIPDMYPPTPEGMTCEIEPLWVAPLTGEYGCYAVTCYINQQYYDGTESTCVQPWRWPVP